MDAKPSKRSALLWFLVLIAVVVVWWYLRPHEDAGAGRAQYEADRLAAVGADPDDVIVDLRDDASPALVASIEQRLGIDLVLISDQAKDEQVYRAHVDPSREAAILDALARTKGVEIAEPDATYSLSPGELVATEVAPPEAGWAGFPDDPLYAKQWHLKQIGMPEAWKLADGGGVIVAVLDTGVAFEDRAGFHQVEDLKGIEYVKPYDFVSNTRNANDDHGHGTHVTGTIAQMTNNGKGVAGVARNVKIMPLKVLSGSGSGSVAGIADAIRFAADNGAKVINMSLGGPFPSRVLKKAVEYAHKKGVVVVCAAGNESRGKVGYPAAYPGAIAVASTQAGRGDRVLLELRQGHRHRRPRRQHPQRRGRRRAAEHHQGRRPDPERLLRVHGHVDGVAARRRRGRADRRRGRDQPRHGREDPEGHRAQADRPEVLGRSLRRRHRRRARRDQGGARQARRATSSAWASCSRPRSPPRARQARARHQARRVATSAGVLAGSGGLFFLPWFLPSMSSWFGVEMLTRGVPSWDLSLLGPLSHGNPLFMSALMPLAAIGLAAGVPKLRPIVAGLAVGVAAHLMFFAAVPVFDLRYVPGFGTLDTLWLLANAALATTLATLTLRK
jgi:serine protease